MNLLNSGAKLDLEFSSGILRVTVHPRPRWYVILIEISAASAIVAAFYRTWTQMSRLIHVLVICGGISSALALIIQFFGTETISFDTQRITVCKEIHGWERKKEYMIQDCSELEWTVGSEDCPSGLRCKAGVKSVMIGADILEDDAIKILVALQQYLPAVAQKLCSSPGNMGHFLTLGAGSRK